MSGWPGAATIPATKAEEYYGLYFAGQALQLEPTHLPAQVVYLSLALEKGGEEAGLDKPLGKDVTKLLATVNPDLVNAVLDRALGDGGGSGP